MALKLFVHNDATGTCELAELAPYPVVTTSVVTQEATGHEIATHTDGAGTTVSIQETITEVVLSGAGFVYVDEDGAKTEITLCDMMANVPDNGLVIGG